MLSLLAIEGMAALGAGIAIAFGALAGALSMGFAVSKAIDGIAKQPEADGKIKSTLILGLVFIETAIIYALVIALLIIVM